ncbi:GPR1/FUN34/YaaH family transporter [Leekyejoonella antrihumi]|uniref:Uncharacterized protein n=1 Tax=Leekyejoonella antrihumi TaxID=1660198 RepID=A0A563E054_9MICO|nr:GPR1/FUN34/YaaH family transporter [Leekyejoonella antrihumi]TWP35613.1 hypothetical protein FGL98_13635 [Leekyejoonella antrihumi]
MTTTDETQNTDTGPAIEPASNVFLSGNPSAIGVPTFIAGSVALGLVLIGYVPASAVGASLSIILAATGVGLTISAIWAATLGQSAVAGIFGIFSGFWLSYAVLVLGLLHGWFAITPAAAVRTQGLFLITWLVIIVMLTLGTLRLPLAFTVLFALIDLALAAVLIGTLDGSTGWLHIGGVLVFIFAAVGAYIYFSVAEVITGGGAIPLGRPVIAS